MSDAELAREWLHERPLVNEVSYVTAEALTALLARVRLEGQLEIARKWHSLTRHRAGTYECCRLVTALEREQAAGGSAAAKRGG